MKKYLVHILWLVVAIVVGVGGFFYGKSTAAVSPTGFAGAYGSSTRRLAGGAGGGFTSGQISAMDATSITLQLANGNSEVVFYSSSTPVSEPTIVSPSALKVGTNVMVGGTTNSDGSLTASTIQVRAANIPEKGATPTTTGSGQ
jgi:hypothetical protein